MDNEPDPTYNTIMQIDDRQRFDNEQRDEQVSGPPRIPSLRRHRACPLLYKQWRTFFFFALSLLSGWRLRRQAKKKKGRGERHGIRAEPEPKVVWREISYVMMRVARRG